MITKIISVNEANTIAINDANWERFANRRKIIIEDLEQINEENISIYDAITPKNWTNNENGTITFNDEILKVSDDTHWTHISNWLSHYELWKEKNEEILILEDDITVDKEVYNNALSVIEEFKTINEDYKLLYLQSTSPWFTGLKHYDVSDIEKKEGNLFKLKSTAFDVSGTGAYYIDAKTSAFLSETAKRYNIRPTDGYLHVFLMEGILKYYIPTNYQDWFKLTRKTE